MQIFFVLIDTSRNPELFEPGFYTSSRPQPQHREESDYNVMFNRFDI